ncbi:MAG: phosphonopyruvate decarboxylase [Alphaproteobacteria bacterium]|nr:phosphonopyruvate decarboxylase [Alphaproteobacteria bacterium]
MGPLFAELQAEKEYVSASIEGEALAVAAGAWLSGKETAVFLQNSGLGNLVNVLSSLNRPFGIPSLLFIGWRGQPGVKDEPQHEAMGQITTEMLDLLSVPWKLLSTDQEEAVTQIKQAIEQMRETNYPVAFLAASDTFHSKENGVSRADGGAAPSGTKNTECMEVAEPCLARYEALETLASACPSAAALIATTGKCGRELYSIIDQPQNLYMVGAMGSASAVGLGVALTSDLPTVVVDGDGAALMRLGTMAVVGEQAPENLVHVILDNGCHESTGGQRGAAPNVDFAGIAEACGYGSFHRCASEQSFRDALAHSFRDTGPHLIHLRIKVGSKVNLGRPDIGPFDVARRFREFLAPASA